jgi:hypothetical protein
VEPAGGGERGLGGAQPLRQRREQVAGQRQLALDARRLDRDRLERALAADAAGRGRVEAALEPLQVERGCLDLDRVGRQVGRR